jgi:endogenous inhibitor of DNA gyrase (YacG/DUF329 family)
MAEIKISDEDVAVVGFALCERASLPACDKLCEDCAADGRAVLQALVASGWRREAEVLREAAERMRSSCRHLDGRVFCMSRADDLDRWAAEAEQYVSAGTREGEDQERDEEQEHG